MDSSDSTQDYIGFYLEKLRHGESENAFHALLEVGHSAIPHLVDAFRAERSSSIRADLVSIIWNYRRPETISFLNEALNDEEPAVWRNALDGLVTLASPASLEVLQSNLRQEISPKKQKTDFKRWVNEAIEQVNQALQSNKQ